MNRSVWAKSSLRSHLSRYWTYLLGAGFLLLLLFSLVTKTSSGISNNRWRDHGWTKSTASISRARQESLESINNSTLGFQKVLAISLPERTDHRDGLVLAAALSDFDVDFIDGVRGESIPIKALPPGPEKVREFAGALGAWRAHMNAISKVVSSGWDSALIFEDDVDWDVRLRSQLHDIALGADFMSSNLDNHVVAKVGSQQHSHVPLRSPYGDDWDVLWLGHCGMAIPEGASMMVFENDASVPQLKDVISWNGEEADHLAAFPPHTRVVTESQFGTCSLAYAVSQQGARKLLYELGVHKLDAAFDLMLRDFCQGDSGRQKHRCISVLPQVFDHYRRAGRVDGDSDVRGGEGGQSDEVRMQGMSYTIRWSTRVNMENLLNGKTDYIDQYPGS